MDQIWNGSDWLANLTWTDIISWISSGAIIFGGVVPFIPQYLDIRKKNDAEGFSLYVCLVLLMANTLRILFWFGKRFELPLLAQSLLMNVAMLLMVHLCVKVKNRSQIIRGPDRVFTGVGNHPKGSISVNPFRVFHDFDWRYFWNWTDFQSYVDFMLVVSLVMSLTTFLLLHSTIYIELLGFVALFTEAMLAMPQLIRNCRCKSTEGMSILMVLMWTTGDIFKTTYFILKDQPVQFAACGSIQVLIDVIILCQVKVYGDKSKGGLSAPNAHKPQAD